MCLSSEEVGGLSIGGVCVLIIFSKSNMGKNRCINIVGRDQVPFECELVFHCELKLGVDQRSLTLVSQETSEVRYEERGAIIRRLSGNVPLRIASSGPATRDWWGGLLVLSTTMRCGKNASETNEVDLSTVAHKRRLSESWGGRQS